MGWCSCVHRRGDTQGLPRDDNSGYAVLGGAGDFICGHFLEQVVEQQVERVPVQRRGRNGRPPPVVREGEAQSEHQTAKWQIAGIGQRYRLRQDTCKERQNGGRSQTAPLGLLRVMHLVRGGHHLVAALQVDPKLQTPPILCADGHLGVHDTSALHVNIRRGNHAGGGEAVGGTASCCTKQATRLTDCRHRCGKANEAYVGGLTPTRLPSHESVLAPGTSRKSLPITSRGPLQNGREPSLTAVIHCTDPGPIFPLQLVSTGTEPETFSTRRQNEAQP